MKDIVTKAASLSDRVRQHRATVEELFAEPWPINRHGVLIARWSVLTDLNAAIKQLTAARDLIADAHWWPTPADYEE
jgi:hypothetical protein